MDTVNLSNFSNTKHFDLMVPYINSISIALAIIFILGLLLNTISILTILNTKNLKPIKLLILNLALADIVYTLGIPLFVTNVFSQNWPFKLIGCQLFFLTDFIGMIVGVYTVVSLCIERYFEVVHRKFEKMKNSLKLKIIYLFMIATWLFAFSFSLPIILSIQLVQLVDNSFMCETNWSEFSMHLFFTIKFVFMFIIPFSLILFSSIKLLLFLKNHKTASINQLKAIRLIESMQVQKLSPSTSKSVSKNQHTSLRFHLEVSKNYETVSSMNRLHSIIFNDSKRDKNKPTDSKRNIRKSQIQSNVVRMKAIKIVLSIVFLFIIQWSPLWFAELYKAVVDELIENIQLINVITTLISYSNSISNPLLYIFLTHDFRKYLNDVLARLRKKY